MYVIIVNQMYGNSFEWCSQINATTIHFHMPVREQCVKQL